MYREYARLQCHADQCPKTYGMYRDQMTKLGIMQKQVGKVDVDELKLKSGFPQTSRMVPPQQWPPPLANPSSLLQRRFQG
jgi:hypothetical protein